MTNKRTLNLSCNENESNKAKPLYKSALKSIALNYSKQTVENARRKRNRNVIWFNPSHSFNVKKTLTKYF